MATSAEITESPAWSRPEDSLARYQSLIDWVTRYGGFFHDDIVIANDLNRGYHALVKPSKSISKNTRISSCPMELTLCVLNALDIEPFKCRGLRFPSAFLDRFCTTPEVLQTFFLMEQYLLGEKSWWAFYIATLPTIEDTKSLQFETPEDRLWISGTNLEGAIDLQVQKWLQGYSEGLEVLKRAGWENAQQGKLTWDLFRWATIIFGTRSFTSQVLSDTTPADIARPLGRRDPHHQMLSKLFADRFAVLLPCLDILNHKPQAQIEWQARLRHVGLEVLEDYTEGQELFNNYGPRDNESLLLSYGFVLEHNEFDHIVVSIRVPPGSPLEDARTWPVDNRSNEFFNCYIFGPQHPIVTDGTHLERAFFSYDLLDSISVLTANDRELQIMYNAQKTLMSSSLPRDFSDFRNLLATLSQLMQDCRARVGRLKHYDPTRQTLPRLPQSQKQRYAQMYRESQLAILQHAISICAFVILHACTDLQNSDIVLTLQLKVPQFHSPSIGSVVQRLGCVTRQNELLTVDAIIRLLPLSIREPLQTMVEDVTKAQDQSVGVPTSHSDVIKSGFAVAIAAIGHEYLNGHSLNNSRLTRWFDDLTQWYPPADENWSYVPSDGPWAAGEEPPQALLALLAVITTLPRAANSAWLQPNMVCWGWNVMEEEGVRVPIEIERFCNGIVEASIEAGAIGFVIYCRQSGTQA